MYIYILTHAYTYIYTYKYTHSYLPYSHAHTNTYTPTYHHIFTYTRRTLMNNTHTLIHDHLSIVLNIAPTLLSNQPHLRPPLYSKHVFSYIACLSNLCVHVSQYSY